MSLADAATEPSRVTTRTVRVFPGPLFPTASRAAIVIVYSPSGTTVPPLALPSHVTATAPPVEATVNVRTVVLPSSATRTAIEPASLGMARRRDRVGARRRRSG